MKTIKLTLYLDKPGTCEMSELLTGIEMRRALRLLEVENGRQRREYQRKLHEAERVKTEKRNDTNVNEKDVNDGQRTEPESKPKPAELPKSSSLAGAIAAKQAERAEPVQSTRTTALAGVVGSQRTKQ